MRSKSWEPVKAPRSPGAFMPDGGYYADGMISNRGPVDRFVRALCKSREGPGFLPESAAAAIQLVDYKAFPTSAQWQTVGTWQQVQTSTSAEEAVKRCGLGAFGPDGEERHWCGQRWVEGPEKSCDSEGHRIETDHEKVRVLVNSLLGSMLVPSRTKHDVTPTSYGTMLKPANEDYFA